MYSLAWPYAIPATPQPVIWHKSPDFKLLKFILLDMVSNASQADF